MQTVFFFLPSYGRIDTHGGTPMIRRLLKIVTFLFIVAVIIMLMIYYALFIAVAQTGVRYETLSSTKIPKVMDNIKIAYFTDLEYGFSIDEERLSTIVDTINYNSADVVIFGGDLFDDAKTITDDDINIVKELLTNIDAPLGKFAVLGERDCENDEIRELITSLLTEANFEILDNRSLHIRNGSNSGIVLIGVEPLINGSPNLSQATAKISEEEYNILITHCPDLFAQDGFPYNSISLGIAGHSHGSQINIPLLGPYTSVEGATNYPLGKYQINNMELQVSSGVGTTNVNARLFSSSEIVFYRLQHEE